jgi:hypothetical protein
LLLLGCWDICIFLHTSGWDQLTCANTCGKAKAASLKSLRMPRAAPEARINPRSIVRKAIQSDRWARLRIFIYNYLHNFTNTILAYTCHICMEIQLHDRRRGAPWCTIELRADFNQVKGPNDRRPSRVFEPVLRPRQMSHQQKQGGNQPCTGLERSIIRLDAS